MNLPQSGLKSIKAEAALLEIIELLADKSLVPGKLKNFGSDSSPVTYPPITNFTRNGLNGQTAISIQLLVDSDIDANGKLVLTVLESVLD